MADDARVMLRRAASARALRLRRQLGVAASDPVDVLVAIRRMRLWLVFAPLDRLFGMYQRQDETSGIVLNVKVHPSMQRFTAAHELGHHVLGHDLALDTEEHVRRWSKSSLQELGAQMFAAEFLMPVAAVNAAASALRVGLSYDAASVYQMSLRLRTSYSAMITRLQTLQRIDRQIADALRRVPPRSIKREILGEGLADSRSDVWLVEGRGSDSNSVLSPLTGDEVVVNVPETPSSGYRWEPHQLPRGIAFKGEDFQEPASPTDVVVGGTGLRRFRFEVREPGRSRVGLILQRPWEPAPADELAFILATDERPRPGVDTLQKQALLATG